MSHPVKPSPEKLIRLARGGDDAALGRLLELYRNYLATLAGQQIGRRLQGKLDAADLVQETFLEAHRDFPAFRGAVEAELVGWLRQILARNLANVVQRYCGTQRRDVRLERELNAELEQSSRVMEEAFRAPGSSPGHEAARREQSVLLADTLSRLPDDYREILVLRHLEGLSFPLVARRMNRSVDSVKKLWARALDRLPHSLGENS